MVRRVIGESSNPNHVLQTRIKLDRALYASEDDLEEINVDPAIEADDGDFNALIDEFGWENVDLAHHFLHRHRMFKMHILKSSDLDGFDIIAFMLIEEEQSLLQAEQSARMQAKTNQ